jgi:nucleotide-binding universal stress UspA family protein
VTVEKPQTFSNVIVGVGEALSGRDAIALARELVRYDGTLTLAHVYTGHTALLARAKPGLAASEQERALALLGHVREESGASATLQATGSRSVGRGLHELAEELGADLLVIGSTHFGLVGRVMIGDDTSDALGGAPCAVAIAPAGHSLQARTIRKIVVGYDGSPESRHAVEVARGLAADYGAELCAFRAVTLPANAVMGGSYVTGGIIDDCVADARRELDELPDIEREAVYGDPAEELSVRSGSADLLVVGSRDYGPVGRLVHGSTSRRLARSARCPLLVLTRAARA